MRPKVGSLCRRDCLAIRLLEPKHLAWQCLDTAPKTGRTDDPLRHLQHRPNESARLSGGAKIRTGKFGNAHGNGNGNGTVSDLKGPEDVAQSPRKDVRASHFKAWPSVTVLVGLIVLRMGIDTARSLQQAKSLRQFRSARFVGRISQTVFALKVPQSVEGGECPIVGRAQLLQSRAIPPLRGHEQRNHHDPSTVLGQHRAINRRIKSQSFNKSQSAYTKRAFYPPERRHPRPSPGCRCMVVQDHQNRNRHSLS
jgi:hypothetical protein